jgi:hypothetical protein
MDMSPGSKSNIANFLDVTNPTLFPKAFCEGTITGTYKLQHTSDLMRWPLLLKYGGVYTVAGMIQISGLDRLWDATIGDLDSAWAVLSYSPNGDTKYSLTNYFLGSLPRNPLFARCHALLMAL